MGFLEQKHIDKIFGAYSKFESEEYFAALVDKEDVFANEANMASSLYVQPKKLDSDQILPFEEAFEDWEESGRNLKSSISELFKILEN